MSQSKPSKLSIRNRAGAEDALSVGANMIVLLDGVPVKGCTFVKFEVKAKGLAKVYLEMYATVEVDANVEVQQVGMKDTGFTENGKLVALHQLGNYSPAKIVTKVE